MFSKHYKTNTVFLFILLMLAAITSQAEATPRGEFILKQQPEPLPDFVLFDDNFKPLRKQSLQGHWTLIYFGYLNCPDVCPTTLQTLAEVQSKLIAEGIKSLPEVVFVSVDPWRDTPKNIKQYVEYFNKDFIGASADAPQLNVLTNFFKIIYYNNRSQQKIKDYEVAHSDQVILINPKVEFVGAFRSPLDSRFIAQQLNRMMKQNP